MPRWQALSPADTSRVCESSFDERALRRGSFARRLGPAACGFFSVCFVAVVLSGVYIFKNRKKLFSRDPNVTADHYGARNLRLWQVILVWVLAVDLLVTMLWRL